jgi:hypothetical protein
MIRDMIRDRLIRGGKVREEIRFDEHGLIDGALSEDSVISATKLREFSDLKLFMDKIAEASDFDARIEFDPATRVAVFSFTLKKHAPKAGTE